MIIVENIDHINIAVTDLESSAKFYSELFDFEVLNNRDNESILMTLDPIKIKLIKIDKVKNQLTELGLPTLSFTMDVDDFTEAINEIEAKKIKIEKGPEEIDGGESLLFSDPSGNLIEIYYQE
ncbi:MAG: VOC family protein [Leptospiraceae bacterium]|nr:VOC family protein [Leptospiraceae bacterium]MCK6381563.1 VOC family protein [Leptospiraceae bacterium]NUM41674.1 VOC family protein [Leptospiraceae bacterium]